MGPGAPRLTTPGPSPAGPQEAEPLSPSGSHDDRAPAWFGDFANGLLSAQKLTAALIVLHTGKDSLGLLAANGEAPGWEARLGASGSLDTPLVNPSSLHLHHPCTPHQASVEEEPLDEHLVGSDRACSVSSV